MTISKVGSQISSQVSLGDVERQLRTLKSKAQDGAVDPSGNEAKFFDLLKEGLREVNTAVQHSEKASLDMAAGKPVNLHETMLSVTKAELALNLAVQMRNKMVEAYQEVMRMQV
jgi:flagellar hook-basal body complex protein FliE